MRLDPIPPEKLSSEQRPLYDRIDSGIRKYFKGFISAREDGALVGIFNPLVRYPQFGGAAWEYIMALSEHSTLPRAPHEVAILVVGAQFSSRYQIYAHEHVAAMACLSTAKVATIDAGERPSDLTHEESVAYDVASRLVRGGQLPEAIYQMGLSTFGEQGVAELVYLLGGYCFIAAILNAYDVAVPGSGEPCG